MTDDTTPNHATRDASPNGTTANDAPRDDTVHAAAPEQAAHDNSPQGATRNDTAPNDATAAPSPGIAEQPPADPAPGSVRPNESPGSGKRDDESGNARPDAASPTPAETTPSPPADVEGTARYRRPLITAIEIENFKGIGAPVRIELRPITLLFGQNSAGKSTVLHALCYAHELLTNGNADAHRTGPGGDRIDLGGFRQFVHQHEIDREVRLRFDLNLEDWTGHTPLRAKTPSESYDDELESILDGLQEMTEDLVRRVTSGWVELRSALRGTRPALISCEVGVNDALVGRFELAPPHIDLVFNSEHPMLAVQPSEGSISTSSSSSVHDGAVGRVIRSTAETAGRLVRALVYLDSESIPLPKPGEFLHLEPREMQEAGYAEDGIRAEMGARLTKLLVDVVHTLGDALARFRYIGPVRELRPPARNESRDPDAGHWSTGSAAWMRLRDSANLAIDRASPLLIQAVSDWLERADRLDTGYALRTRSVVKIEEGDATLVRDLRTYHQLRSDFGGDDGSVDLDRWLRQRARAIRDFLKRYTTFPVQVDALEEAVRTTVSGKYVLPEHDFCKPEVDAAADEYRRNSKLVSKIERREFSDEELADLGRALSAHPSQREPQLVKARSGLPVRVSDVGVGISQVLPIVVAALHGPELTAIEQPELHVHPKMQVEIGELLAQQDGHRTFLIETHSEHLLLRIMRRMRQTFDDDLPEGAPDLRPSDVNVLFVEVDPEQDRTLIREMRLNERGELVDAWPGGFFEEDMREIF